MCSWQGPSVRAGLSVPADCSEAASPMDVVRRLRAQGEQPVLLLSGDAQVANGRSLVGIRPDETIVCEPGTGGGLPAIPPRLVHVASGQGLWVGAIAYDAGLDHLGIFSRHVPDVPALMAQWHASYAAFDHASGRWDLHGAAGEAHDVLAAAIADPLTAPALAELPASAARSWCTRAEHVEACREIQRLIARGEVFEVNLTHVLRVSWQRDGFELFERMLAESAGDHSAYLCMGGTELVSISPERFLGIDGRRCETRPIKGTRRRGSNESEDARLAEGLLASHKDRAENVMIVDLMRNDLTATAVSGSVVVEGLCLLEKTPSVMHLVSVVTSVVRDSVRLPDVLVSCFPGGSITGAPKRRAMEIIDRLERGNRGFYCGSVFGWEPAQQRLVASIAIRTATVRDGMARYGAGGAITLLSDPDEEADETMIKARPFLNAVNARVEGW